MPALSRLGFAHLFVPPSVRRNSIEVTLYAFTTDDGAAVVVDGFEPPTQGESPQRDDGTLSAEVEALEWVGEAVAAGVTFEVLRSLAAHLIAGGWRQRQPEPSIEAIGATLTEYLTSLGYLDIQLAEVRRVGDQGWLITGAADGAVVQGRADPSGQLLHVRIT